MGVLSRLWLLVAWLLLVVPLEVLVVHMRILDELGSLLGAHRLCGFSLRRLGLLEDDAAWLC